MTPGLSEGTLLNEWHKRSVFGIILGEIRCYSTVNSVRDSGSFQRNCAERMSFEVDEKDLFT